MKVRQLIAALKKMPPELEVYTNAHDNSEWEISGNTSTVECHMKETLRIEYDLDTMLSNEDKRCFEGTPKAWVIIRS